MGLDVLPQGSRREAAAFETLRLDVFLQGPLFQVVAAAAIACAEKDWNLIDKDAEICLRWVSKAGVNARVMRPGLLRGPSGCIGSEQSTGAGAGLQRVRTEHGSGSYF